MMMYYHNMKRGRRSGVRLTPAEVGRVGADRQSQIRIAVRDAVRDGFSATVEQVLAFVGTAAPEALATPEDVLAALGALCSAGQAAHVGGGYLWVGRR